MNGKEKKNKYICKHYVYKYSTLFFYKNLIFKASNSKSKFFADNKFFEILTKYLKLEDYNKILLFLMGKGHRSGTNQNSWWRFLPCEHVSVQWRVHPD